MMARGADQGRPRAWCPAGSCPGPVRYRRWGQRPRGASVPSRPSNHSVLAALRGPDPLGSTGPSRREIGGAGRAEAGPAPRYRVWWGSSTVLPPHTEGVAGSGLVFIATTDRDLARPGGGGRKDTHARRNHPPHSQTRLPPPVGCVGRLARRVRIHTFKGPFGPPRRKSATHAVRAARTSGQSPGLGPRTGCRDLSGRITPREDAGYSQRLRGSWRAAGDR